MPQTKPKSPIATFFSEMNIFVNRPLNGRMGLRFWAAKSYMDPGMSREDASSFLTSNLVGSEKDIINTKEKQAFNRQHISPLRMLNPLKPLYIGIEYLKSKIGAGIDALAGDKTVSKDSTSSTGAKIAKIGVQILFAPIELPILIGAKLIDVALDGIGALRRKIAGRPRSLPKNQPIELTELPVSSEKTEKEQNQLTQTKEAQKAPEVTVTAAQSCSTSYMRTQMNGSTTLVEKKRSEQKTGPEPELVAAEAQQSPQELKLPQQPKVFKSLLQKGVTPSFEKHIVPQFTKSGPKK